MNVRQKILLKYVNSINTPCSENDFFHEHFVSKTLTGSSKKDDGTSIYLSSSAQKISMDNLSRNSSVLFPTNFSPQRKKHGDNTRSIYYSCDIFDSLMNRMSTIQNSLQSHTSKRVSGGIWIFFEIYFNHVLAYNYQAIFMKIFLDFITFFHENICDMGILYPPKIKGKKHHT